MSTPFKMKGYNYPGTSPMRNDEKLVKSDDSKVNKEEPKVNVEEPKVNVEEPKVNVDESVITRQQRNDAVASKGGNIKENLENQFKGTTWGRVNGVWKTSDGRKLSDM